MFQGVGALDEALKLLVVVTDGQTTALEGVTGLDLLRDPIAKLKVKFTQ